MSAVGQFDGVLQEQPNKTEKTIDGSVHGQRCSRTLEADRYFCWFSLVWYVICHIWYRTYCWDWDRPWMS